MSPFAYVDDATKIILWPNVIDSHLTKTKKTPQPLRYKITSFTQVMLNISIGKTCYIYTMAVNEKRKACK